MKPLFLLIFLISLTAFSGSSQAQTIREISSRPAMFSEELDRLTESISSRQTRREKEPFIHQFKRLWESDTLKIQQKELIIEHINKMLSNRHRVDPDIFLYLEMVLYLSRSHNRDENFRGSGSGLTFFIDRLSNRQVNQAIGTLHTLFKEGFLTQSRSGGWQITTDVFTVEFQDESREFVVQVPKTDLIAYAYNDSSMLYNTSGYFDIRRERWHGKGGVVTWEIAGLDPDKVYALLNDYEINMRTTKYVINKVNFFHKEYFSEPLIGRLTNQTETGVSTGRVKRINFPRFVSQEGETVIEDIFPDIDYHGSFSMIGNRLVASATPGRMASIVVMRDDKPFLRLTSNEFGIDSNRIVSPMASVAFYLEEDSIFHPAIRLTYENDRRLISLFRETEGLSQSPFYNTYHQVDINVEAIFWQLDQEKIAMQNLPSASGMSSAAFRSANFYDQREFERIQGMDRQNPLFYIRDFYAATQMQEFGLNDMVRFMNFPPEAIKAMLLRLANMGFLNYNLETDQITIRDRLFFYLDARAGKTDYDVISFNSQTQRQSNAELSLLDYTIQLYGVRGIQLSDSQNVIINPKNQTLTLKKNRDFDFSGMLRAGRFVLRGTDFSFSYDNFHIDLPIVDSMEFWVRPFEEHRDKMADRQWVQSKIRQVRGTLQIDDPKNKAGLKDFPQYPVLQSEGHSFVYYHNETGYKEAYNPDVFYYRIDPFTLDSLNDFQTQTLNLSGYLASGGIFPTIEYPLSVQRDYSLGFVHQTPETGYPAYGGKGHYNDQIMLSNKGLIGDGTLKYITSTSISPEFKFFPDSTIANLTSYSVAPQKGQVEYPQASGEQVFMKWEPHKDHMTVETLDKPVNMFDMQANIQGTLNYTPQEMTGKGSMEIADAIVESRLLRYKNQTIDADSCNFRLVTMTSEFGLGAGDQVEQDLVTNNYKGHITFEDRTGEFISNSGASRVEFSVNQYISFIDRFLWYMDKEELTFSMDAHEERAAAYNQLTKEQLIDKTLEGARFISTHPAQDSLEFIADHATYNRTNQTITANGVRIINVADAAIFPYEQQLKIFRQAEMDRLENSYIIANTTSRYHHIQDAIANISGRYDYFGRGNYFYEDKTGEKQSIYMNEISVDSLLLTNATGIIEMEDQFSLSPAFLFQGEAKILSTNPHLTFDGGFQIRNPCNTVQQEWVKFKHPIDPQNVMIPIDTHMINLDQQETYASIRYATGVKQVYSSFYAFDDTPRQRRGNTIFTSNGMIMYDDVAAQYRIGPKERLQGGGAGTGNLTTYDTRNCTHIGEGHISFFEESGQVSIETMGRLEHHVKDDSTLIRGTIALDFLFEEDALEYMAKSISEHSGLRSVDLNTDRFGNALKYMLGEEMGREMIEELSVYNRIRRMPAEMKRTMILTDVSFQWHERLESFIASGPVGIAYLGENQVTRYVDAYIVFSKGRRSNFSDGEFTIYLEASSGEWYYFNYNPAGRMSVVGASEQFRTIINDLDSDDRVLDTPSGETPFRYHLGGTAQKEQFLRNLRRFMDN